MADHSKLEARSLKELGIYESEAAQFDFANPTSDVEISEETYTSIHIPGIPWKEHPFYLGFEDGSNPFQCSLALHVYDPLEKFEFCHRCADTNERKSHKEFVDLKDSGASKIMVHYFSIQDTGLSVSLDIGLRCPKCNGCWAYSLCLSEDC